MLLFTLSPDFSSLTTVKLNRQVIGRWQEVQEGEDIGILIFDFC